jgi:LytR cell envelope-related transcriptional attenuator
MADLLQEVGAYAGVAAFIGLAVLALLYFAQARDVRRLRDNASFLVEGNEVPTDSSSEQAAAAVAAKEPEEAAAAAAATAPSDREAFRRAELARQAAERRKRFEQRRRGPARPSVAGRGDGGRPSWLRETPSVVVLAVGALLLLAGIGFGATRLLGDDDEAAPQAKSGPAAAAQTKVAVLNSTAQGGLAAEFAALLKPGGYKTSPVTNTESPFDTSVVMFDQTNPQAQEAAAQVAADVGIQDVQPMSTEIRSISEGATVAVILGEDQASGVSSTGTTDTSGI